MDHIAHGFSYDFRIQLSLYFQGLFKANLEVGRNKRGHKDEAQAVNEKGHMGNIEVTAYNLLGNPFSEIEK